MIEYEDDNTAIEHTAMQTTTTKSNDGDVALSFALHCHSPTLAVSSRCFILNHVKLLCDNL